MKNKLAIYLIGQVVAAYRQVRLTPQDFGSPRKRDFAKLNLHLVLFEEPGKDDFFRGLIVIPSQNPATYLFLGSAIVIMLIHFGAFA